MFANILLNTQFKLQWINGQYEQLKKWNSSTAERARASERQLTSISLSNSGSLDEFANQSREQLLAGLTQRQRDFLKSHELDAKLVIDHLKRMRQHIIRNEVDKIKRNVAPDTLRKCSFLSNQLSRSTTYHSSCAAMMAKQQAAAAAATPPTTSSGKSNDERLDPFAILIDYFNS